MHGNLSLQSTSAAYYTSENAPHWVQLHERCSQNHVCKSLSIDCQSVDPLNTLVQHSSQRRPAGSFASGWIVARGAPLFQHSPVCFGEIRTCFLPSCWCLTVLTSVISVTDGFHSNNGVVCSSWNLVSWCLLYRPFFSHTTRDDCTLSILFYVLG